MVAQFAGEAEERTVEVVGGAVALVSDAGSSAGGGGTATSAVCTFATTA